MKIPRDVYAVPAGDGLALYRAGSSRLHVLNPTGRILWQELAAGRPVDAAAREIARRFAVPLSRAGPDCRKAAAALRAALRAEPVDVAPMPQAAAVPASVHEAAGRDRHCRIGGLAFCVRASDALWPQLHPVVGHLHSPHQARPAPRFEAASVDGAFVLNQDDRELARPKTISGLLYRLLQAIASFALSQPGRLAWLHAGAVLHGGRCLVFPARGGSGKTTLVTGLMRRGATVLADDVLGVDEKTQDVLPLPLPLSIKRGSWPIVAPNFPELMKSPVLAIGPKRVRLLPPPVPADGAWERGHRAACLINPVFRAGAAAAIEPTGGWEMLQIMFDARSIICRPSAARVRKLVRWVAALPAYRLVYDDLESAERLIAGLP